MHLFPAIDLFGGAAVRLFQGDYAQMTVYSNNPLEIAADFLACGADHIHMVDLEGAKTGQTPNLPIVERVAKETPLFVEIGGGIREIQTARRYMQCGVDRIILGTAAVKDPDFLQRALGEFGPAVAVGVDIKDGQVAIHGWTEQSGLDAMDFCDKMERLGVKNLICTDISKDGAMIGTNRALYQQLSRTFSIDITASGGVSTIDDIRALRAMDLYGAIIGKAYYTGAISLKEALEVAK